MWNTIRWFLSLVELLTVQYHARNQKEAAPAIPGAAFALREESAMQEVGFKEAGELLNTPVSTLRRWVVLLEEQGYTFNRDGKRRQLDWQDVGFFIRYP